MKDLLDDIYREHGLPADDPTAHSLEEIRYFGEVLDMNVEPAAMWHWLGLKRKKPVEFGDVESERLERVLAEKPHLADHHHALKLAVTLEPLQEFFPSSGARTETVRQLSRRSFRR